MAINQYVKHLITKLAENEYDDAKAYARIIIKGDDSEKNRVWREKTLKKMDYRQMYGLIQLSSDIAGFSELYHPDSDYFTNRYFLPRREKPVYEEVMRKEHVVRRMRMLGVPASNTLLLEGAPGVGKTEFARYLAYAMQKPLLCIRLSQIIDSYLGATGKNIGQVFDFFHKNDVILFLDEIDTIANRRTDAGEIGGEISRVTAAIMQELDRMDGAGIIIAATNRADLLDEALLRRFSIQHMVVLPDEDERVAMTERFWASVGIPAPDEAISFTREKNTPAAIATRNISLLSEYLEKHEEMTPVEMDAIQQTSIPECWMRLFLQVAEALNVPSQNAAEVEKHSYSMQRIASQLPVPSECEIQYGSENISFNDRVDSYCYSIFICRMTWRERTRLNREVTMQELAEWVREEIATGEE
jgi:hypothetical protein